MSAELFDRIFRRALAMDAVSFPDFVSLHQWAKHAEAAASVDSELAGKVGVSSEAVHRLAQGSLAFFWMGVGDDKLMQIARQCTRMHEGFEDQIRHAVDCGSAIIRVRDSDDGPARFVHDGRCLPSEQPSRDDDLSWIVPKIANFLRTKQKHPQEGL